MSTDEQKTLKKFENRIAREFLNQSKSTPMNDDFIGLRFFPKEQNGRVPSRYEIHFVFADGKETNAMKTGFWAINKHLSSLGPLGNNTNTGQDQKRWIGDKRTKCRKYHTDSFGSSSYTVAMTSLQNPTYILGTEKFCQKMLRDVAKFIYEERRSYMEQAHPKLTAVLEEADKVCEEDGIEMIYQRLAQEKDKDDPFKSMFQINSEYGSRLVTASTPVCFNHDNASPTPFEFPAEVEAADVLRKSDYYKLEYQALSVTDYNGVPITQKDWDEIQDNIDTTYELAVVGLGAPYLTQAKASLQRLNIVFVRFLRTIEEMKTNRNPKEPPRDSNKAALLCEQSALVAKRTTDPDADLTSEELERIAELEASYTQKSGEPPKEIGNTPKPSEATQPPSQTEPVSQEYPPQEEPDNTQPQKRKAGEHESPDPGRNGVKRNKKSK